MTQSRALDVIMAAMKEKPADRRLFLERAGEGDPELANHLRELLPDPTNFQAFDQLIDQSRKSGSGTLTAASEKKGPPELPLGSTVGEFTLVQFLGRGAFAIVYLAHQASLDRHVALKISTLVGREAQILGQLDHDNIVRVYSEAQGMNGTVRMICMQYIDGATLEDVVVGLFKRKSRPSGSEVVEIVREHAASGKGDAKTKEGESPLLRFDFQEAVLWIGARLAQALEYAHQRGVLHLDVKPTNVILNRAGRPFLMDFNVSLDARVTAEDRRNSFGGTLDYMSPEQFEAFQSGGSAESISRIDGRADVYSLGTVLTQLLSRERTTASETRRHTLLLKDATFRKSQERQDGEWRSIDLGIRMVLEKSTDEDPAKRFPSAASFADALESCLELRRIAKALPKPGTLALWGVNRPFFLITLGAVLPMLFLSPIAIGFALHSWSSLWGIPTRLGWLGMGVTTIPFLFLILLWGGRLRSLRTDLNDARVAFRGQNRGRQSRASLLTLPQRFLTLAVLGWLPLAVTILLMMHFLVPILDDYGFARGLAACGLAGLFATGLSTFWIQILALKLLYPRLWLGESNIRGKAAGELSRARVGLRVSYVLMVCSPMAAVALRYTLPQIFITEDAFLPLVFGAASALAVLLAFTASSWMAQFNFAFTGQTESGKLGSKSSE